MKTKGSTGEERDDSLATLRLAVERASSEAQSAERRYMAVDPDRLCRQFACPQRNGLARRRMLTQVFEAAAFHALELSFSAAPLGAHVFESHRTTD